MSLYAAMNAATSGMAAQSNRLSAVADNIANSDTRGYKRVSAEFETVLGEVTPGYYTSSGVSTDIRYSISEQGALTSTSSATDLAVNGRGFFVVANANGEKLLTRAGSFTPDSSGNLVNAAGFTLMGYDIASGTPTMATNSLSDMVKVQIASATLAARPSTLGHFAGNVPSDATAVAASNLPSTNSATATYTDKSSLVAYDNLGHPVTLDIFLTKSANNAWDIAVYNHADAPTTGSFPYTSGPLAAQTLQFDPTTGKLATASVSSLAVTVPNGQPMTIDLASMTQLAAAYAVSDAGVNGHAPNAVQSVEIGTDGVLTNVYADGTRVASYQIPLADVMSPDKLTLLPGNAWQASAGSGDVRVGTPTSGGLGSMRASTLEQSTVDLATELTTMIAAQHDYTANSKVFQTSADLLDVLTNLKR